MHGVTRPSSTGQITLFPDRREPAAPGRVLLVGVDDALAERRPVPTTLVRFSDDLGVRYLAEWELKAAGLTPSFWVSPPLSEFGRHACFETIRNELVEQDDAGRMWIDEGLVCSGSLFAFGAPARGREGGLVLGEDSALLLGRHGTDGWELRIRTTSAVLWIFALPDLRPAPRLPDWMRLAVPAPLLLKESHLKESHLKESHA
jgi:hypothetical protein